MGREVGLELRDALTPVRGRLLADELDVEEGALPGAEGGARGGPPDDSGRDVRHDVLMEDNDTEPPADKENRYLHSILFPWGAILPRPSSRL